MKKDSEDEELGNVNRWGGSIGKRGIEGESKYRLLLAKGEKILLCHWAT